MEIGRLTQEWKGLQGVPPLYFTCGHCGANVAPNQGYFAGGGGPTRDNPLIHICTGCNRPTYTYADVQVPMPSLGQPVAHLPQDVASVYDEARRCTTVSSCTSAVLTCRKLIMHIAVDKGAKENESFKSYVDYLATAGWVPPGGDAWVNKVRNEANDANHELSIKTKDQAETVLAFVEMLLRFMYEFPTRAGAAPPRKDGEDPA